FLMTRPIRLSPLATAVGLLSSAVLRAQQPPFTLEQVMSAPFPDELVAAPAAGAVAWVSNARGARNVWVAGPPDYQGKPVTSYAEDEDRKSTRLNSSHVAISYAVFCLKKKKKLGDDRLYTRYMLIT